MSLFSDEFLGVAAEARRRYAPAVDAIGPGIREWLIAGGQYSVASSERLRLQVVALDGSWATSNSSDSMRFFWAAHESIVPRSHSSHDSRSIGWASVSTYYSGLYLVLGLLRLFGYGLMYVTSDDTAKISAAPGTTSRLDGGVYTLKIELGSQPTIRLEKMSVRGFHEGFWRYADDCLTQISNEISAGTGAARALSVTARGTALLSVEDIRTWLGKPGSSNRDVGWMSSLRNEVNYRLRKNAWAPDYQAGGVAIDRLRQDMIGIVRGNRDKLGAQLRLDRDIRAMIRTGLCFVPRNSALDWLSENLASLNLKR